MIRKKRGKKVLIIIFITFFVFLLTLLISFFSIYFSVKLDDDAVITKKAQVKLYDKKDEEIKSDVFNRYVKYEDINTNIINAFVSLEDKRFFKHKGVDYYRTIGALVHNLKAGYSKEGGSTITQQLAKNTQLSSEKTIIRKIKEMKLASDIEKRYTKEEILEMYLNAIYYGNGIYGIDSACKYYFGKSPADVTLSESAILAGIVKSPQNYSPRNYPEKSTTRMQLVLKLMKEQGYIDEQEYRAAQNYQYIDTKEEYRSPYISAVIEEACDVLKITEAELIKSELKINTYYDKEVQNKIEDEYQSGEYQIITKCGEKALSYCAIADNLTHGICAYYDNGDISIKMRRQPGSIIKPIVVYCPALNNHTITTAEIFNDEKKDFDGYSPNNYRNIYYGKVDVETALKKSINTVAVEIFDRTGSNYCISLAKKIGITIDDKDNNLALALGGMTYGVNLKEIITSYMTLANSGKKYEVGFIESIVDKKGKVLYRNSDKNTEIFSEEAAFLTTDMLIKTAKDGTAKKLNKVPYLIAAKTGTVDGVGGNNSDAWCVSFTPKYTCCAWFGGKDYTESQTINTTGGGMPTLLTANIFDKMERNNEGFHKPKSIVSLDIDGFSQEKEGLVLLANVNTPNKYRKSYYFDINNRPKEYSPYFTIDDQLFSAEKYDELVKVSLRVQYPYSYRIYNISDKKEKNLSIYETTVEDIFNPNKCFIFDRNEINTPLYIEVTYEGKVIGINVCEEIKTNYY